MVMMLLCSYVGREGLGVQRVVMAEWGSEDGGGDGDFDGEGCGENGGVLEMEIYQAKSAPTKRSIDYEFFTDRQKSDHLSQRVGKPFCHVNVRKSVLIEIANIWRHSRKFPFIACFHRTVPLHSFFSKVASIVDIQVMPGIPDCCDVQV